MEQSPADENSVLKLLRSMYWSCLTRETSHLILAYHEIHRHQPDLSTYETEHTGLEGDNFEKFCNIWIHSTGNKSDTASRSVYDHAIHFARARYASSSTRARRARYLLQALGMLDIDHVHISMDNSTIGRHNHHPQSEVVSINNDTEVVFREMLCSSCSSHLRGYFYYGCEKGCRQRTPESIYIEDQKRREISMQDLPGEVRAGIYNTPFRSCANCIDSPEGYQECEREHLRKIIFKKRKEKDQPSFESRLRNRELQVQNVANPTLRRVVNSLVDPSRYANAGPVHLGMMFGPLLFENGVPGTSSGAVISMRPLPSLCMKPRYDLLITADLQQHEATHLEAHIFDDKNSGDRKMKRVPRVHRKQDFLASVKKVYGGAFSGHAIAFRESELDIIDCFAEVSHAFRYLPGKTVAANRKRLFQQSDVVVSKIRDSLEDEVDLYLQHFANVIADPKPPLRWNLDTNNCQNFAQLLMKTLDTANLFHKLPRNYFDDAAAKMKKKWPLPRYLLSFGPDIDTPIALLRPPVRSLIWNFYHNKRDACDLIEYAEQFRTEASPVPTDAWEFLCDTNAASECDTTTRASKLSLSNALWTLPRDSISILQTHLMRHSTRYSTNDGRCLSAEQWVLNRLQVLHQVDIFASMCSGLADAMLLDISMNLELLPSYFSPTATMHGTLHVCEKVVQYGPIGWVTGRERDWWEREMKFRAKKMSSRLKFR